MSKESKVLQYIKGYLDAEVKLTKRKMEFECMDETDQAINTAVWREVCEIREALVRACLEKEEDIND